MSELIEISWKERVYAVWMFVKLRYSQWSYYYTKWMLEEAWYVAYFAAFYFLSVFIGGGSVVEEYGGNYTAFLLLGAIGTRFFGELQYEPYSRLGEAYRGNLQMYLLSPIGVWAYLFGSIFWITIYWTAMFFVLNLVIGYLVLGLAISFTADLLALLLVMIFSIVSMIGFAFINCSTFSLINAKGGNNPVYFFISQFEGLLSGAYFPITLLPIGFNQWACSFHTSTRTALSD